MVLTNRLLSHFEEFLSLWSSDLATNRYRRIRFPFTTFSPFFLFSFYIPAIPFYSLSHLPPPARLFLRFNLIRPRSHYVHHSQCLAIFRFSFTCSRLVSLINDFKVKHFNIPFIFNDTLTLMASYFLG